MIAALSGFSAVGIGAFGATCLENAFMKMRIGYFQTAVSTTFITHLQFRIVLSDKMPLSICNMHYTFGLGILLFQEAYILWLYLNGFLGPITPIGGLLLLAGWFLIAITALKKFSEI